MAIALDYFGARYCSGAGGTSGNGASIGPDLGRFLTPDWSAQAEPVPYAKLDNPQSLNLYSYVLNNPVSLTDADGHFVGPGQGTDGTDVIYDWVRMETGRGPTPRLPVIPPGAVIHPGRYSCICAAPNNPSGPVRTPAQGQTPDSTVKYPDGKGGSTERTFGPDGRAAKDIDRGHDHGSGDPHAHDWDWTKRPPRQPGRPLTPQEKANLKRAAAGATVGVIIYWVVSEASRILFPPRNLVPVP